MAWGPGNILFFGRIYVIKTVTRGLVFSMAGGRLGGKA